MDRIFRKPLSFTLLSIGLALVVSCDLNRVNSPESGSPSTPKALRTGEIVRLPNLVGAARDSISLPFEADSGRFYTILVGSGRIRPSASIFRDGAKVFAGKRGSADNQVDSIFLPCLRSGTYDLRIAMDSSFHDQTVVLLGDRGLPDSLQLPDARGWRDSAVIPTDGTVWQLTRHGWAGMELETNDTIAMDCDTGFRYIVKDSTLIGHNYLSLSRIVNSDGTSAGYHQIYGGGGGWVFVPTRKGRCFLVFGGSSSVSRYEVSVQKVPGVPASAVVDRFEPDDMFANAKSIFPDGVWQERTIHSNTGNDLNPDYVAFQVDSDKVYSLKIEEGSAAGTATDEAKLRNQRSPLEAIAFWADSSRIPTKDSVGEDMRYLIVPATKTGVVYVRFASYSYGIGYRIALGVVPGAMSEATGTRRGVRLVAAPEKDSFSLSMILTGNDTDCIAIAVRKNRLYTFAPSIQAGLAHLSTTIVESGISTETGSLNYAAVKDGIVHLKLLQVRWQPHPCSKMEPYCLSYSPGPYMQYNLSVGSRELPADPLEPDETMATAPQIDYGTDAIHRWLGMSERDWARFAVSVKQRTRIVVRVDSTYEPGRGGYSVSLIGRDSIMVETQVLENASVGDSVVFDFQPFNDGEIHLQLENLWPTASPLYYSIKADSMTAFDTTEPDDGISTAQTVALDFYSDSAWMLGTRDVRLQAGDEDWSRIEAVAHGRYCVTADRGYPVSHRFFGMDSAALPPVQFFDNPDFVCAEAQANGPIFVRTVALETGTETKPIEEFLVFGQLFKDGGIATAQTVSLSEATDGPDGYGLRDVLLHAGEVEWSRIETVASGRYCVSNPGDPVSHSFFVDKNSVALPLLQDAPPGALCAEALEDGPIFVRTVALVTGTQTIAVNLLFWQLFKDDGITKAQTVALEDSADRHWGFGSRYVELHVRDVEWSRIEAVAHGKYCVSNTDDQVSHRFFDKDSVALPSLQNSPSDAVCAEALANGPIFVRTVTTLETGMTMSFLPFWRLPEPYDENFKIQIP